MTSEGLGEMFEGDSADTCGGKFPLTSIGGQAEGLACADPGSRTPIGASGISRVTNNIHTKILKIYVFQTGWKTNLNIDE